MGKIMLRADYIFYTHIEILCATRPNILKMGIRRSAPKIYIEHWCNS